MPDHSPIAALRARGARRPSLPGSDEGYGAAVVADAPDGEGKVRRRRRRRPRAPAQPQAARLRAPAGAGAGGELRLGYVQVLGHLRVCAGTEEAAAAAG